jgi:hypothetical protein
VLSTSLSSILFPGCERKGVTGNTPAAYKRICEQNRGRAWNLCGFETAAACRHHHQHDLDKKKRVTNRLGRLLPAASCSRTSAETEEREPPPVSLCPEPKGRIRVLFPRL